MNHQIGGQHMCGAPECLSAFGARTFSTVITTSVVQDWNEKNQWRWLYDALIICCVARLVAASAMDPFLLQWRLYNRVNWLLMNFLSFAKGVCLCMLRLWPQSREYYRVLIELPPLLTICTVKGWGPANTLDRMLPLPNVAGRRGGGHLLLAN
jgi:hypothetical protein